MTGALAFVPWKFTSAVEDYASTIFRGMYCQIEKLADCFWTLYFDSRLAGAKARVPETSNPAVTRRTDDIAKRIPDEPFGVALAAEPDIDEDRRSEPTFPFRLINGFDELAGSIAPTPVSPRKQCN